MKYLVEKSKVISAFYMKLSLFLIFVSARQMTPSPKTSKFSKFLVRFIERIFKYKMQNYFIIPSKFVTFLL